MDDVQLLNRKQAADLLSISVRTLDRYVTERLIPVVKFDRGTVRFSRADLLKWINRKTVKVNPFAA